MEVLGYSSSDEDSVDFSFLAYPSPTLLLPLSRSAPAGGEEEGDDGWMTGSDLEEVAPRLGSPDKHDEQFFSKFRKPFMYYDNETWVDEAAATFSAHMQQNPEKVSEALREMFTAHGSVYSLLVAFFQRVKCSRDKKLSLRRVVTAEFSVWLGEQKKASGGDALENIRLTAEHQKEALQILTYCHPVYMDDISLLFELKSAAIDDRLALIHHLLEERKHKVAVTYIWKLGLQEHFDMKQMLLPLVDLDKINTIENYISGNRKLQEQFVSIVDELCQQGASLRLADLTSSSSAVPMVRGDNSKLNPRQLYKLGVRFVLKYGLDLEMFPNIAQRKTSSSLHYLLHKIYVNDSTITATNRDDLIQAAVEGKPLLQSQLIGELVGHFKDLPAAAHWSRELDLPYDALPSALRRHLQETPPLLPPATAAPMCVEFPAAARERSCFLELSLPLSDVHFVDAGNSLQSCWDKLTRPGSVIGIDAEWCLSACNGGLERMALLQLAVSDAVFLLDIAHLQQRVEPETLRQFLADVFASPSLLKLGYGVTGDLSMLTRTWPFAAQPLSCQRRVVDLQTFAKMVKKLFDREEALRAGSNGAPSHSITEVPTHPLLATPTPPIATPPQQQLHQVSFPKPDIPFTPMSKQLKEIPRPSNSSSSSSSKLLPLPVAASHSTVAPVCRRHGASVAPPTRRCLSSGTHGRYQGSGLTLKERYFRALEELRLSSSSSSSSSSANPSPVDFSGQNSTSPPLKTLGTKQDPRAATTKTKKDPCAAIKEMKQVPCAATKETKQDPCAAAKERQSSLDVEAVGAARGGVLRGLSLLVRQCLGRPLDKSQQFSDWKRRPLHTEQIIYAALDAHCLLAVYEKLKSQALEVDARFNVEPSLLGSRGNGGGRGARK